MPSRRQLRWCAAVAGAVVLVLAMYVTVLVVLQTVDGGLHTITAGESYGFTIGMSKEQVLATYRGLDESLSLSAHDGRLWQHIGHDPAAMELAGLLRMSDRWRVDRWHWPAKQQEFAFEADRLVTIVTWVQYYETP